MISPVSESPIKLYPNLKRQSADCTAWGRFYPCPCCGDQNSESELPKVPGIYGNNKAE